MSWFNKGMKRYRHLPTALLMTDLASRFIFGMGVGTMMAGSSRRKWRRTGAIAMIVGTAMAVPPAIKMFRD